jgi:hypothetical protein
MMELSKQISPQLAFYLNRGVVGFALYLVWENADILCPAFEMRCIEN